MSHAQISVNTDVRAYSSSQQPIVQFPNFTQEQLANYDEHAIRDSIDSPGPGPGLIQHQSSDRWQPRKSATFNPHIFNDGPTRTGGIRHGRQKSLSEAIRTVRTRHGSISQNAHEIAEALKAPISAKLVVLCGVWYATSILSNTSSKAILTALPKPVTLTIVQFLFVSSWCVFSAWLAKRFPAVRNAMPVLRNGIRPPSKELIMTTLPLTAFQVGGHILNSDAMSRIPVSLVHTIKGLSPLFTVLAYRIFFNIHYSFPTYASLVPLTLGVILACSASFKGEAVGLLYAFGSALLFVTQNIVSKKLFTDADRAAQDSLPTKNRKPDKLNLLCYSSALAFAITFPLWLWSEGFGIMADFLSDASVTLSERPGSLDHGRLALEFIFNGTFHFSQSLVAFVLLGLTSPVTYSVASLIKRVFVIVFAVVWFGNRMTRVQAFGIGLTIVGLYLYDRTSDAARLDKRMRAKEGAKEMLLPLVNGDAKRSDGPGSSFVQSPGVSPLGMNGRPSPANGDTWLPPGTKAEETWTTEDVARHQAVDAR
ncbi:hypothetical protein MBLNU457_7156t1 [Dothideomycetes sp. NU457]